jgi:hypothetical protein
LPPCGALVAQLKLKEGGAAAEDSTRSSLPVVVVGAEQLGLQKSPGLTDLKEVCSFDRILFIHQSSPGAF